MDLGTTFKSLFLGLHKYSGMPCVLTLKCQVHPLGSSGMLLAYTVEKPDKAAAWSRLDEE